MRYIILFSLIMSCAHKDAPLKDANKYIYLQEFYKLRDELKKESKTCQNYMSANLEKYFAEDSSSKYGYTIKNISSALLAYTPELFDWNTKARLNELYLTYKYNFDIVNEHFEIIHNIQDCSNEFAHLNFLKAALGNKDRVTAKKIIKKYFDYFEKVESSPLSVLINGNLLLDLESENFITFKNKSNFLINKKQLELIFTDSGKKSLTSFRQKDFLSLYNQGLLLKKEKDKFKIFSLSSFTLK